VSSRECSVSKNCNEIVPGKKKIKKAVLQPPKFSTLELFQYFHFSLSLLYPQTIGEEDSSFATIEKTQWAKNTKK
jgi:hypothetical protein